jgi:YEATS domain-containing protein 4
LADISFSSCSAKANCEARPVVESEPFQVEETGWGGFNVDIRLYFNPDSHEKPQYRQHFLQLERYGTEEERAKQEKEKLVRSEICDFVEFNEPTEAFWDAMTSEGQWDYLQKDRGKGKKAALLASGTAGERTVELPDNSTNTNPYSKAMERSFISQFKTAESEVEKGMDREKKKREELDKQIKELREEEVSLKKKLDELRAKKIESGLPVEPLGETVTPTTATNKKK